MKSSLLREIRIGIRTLCRSPQATLAAFLSLALGIGALTAIFSVVYGLLLRPLPYAESDRLVLIWEQERVQAGGRLGGTSDATFEDWRQARSFEMVSALGATSRGLTSLEVPESLFTRPATASHFELFGIEPSHGRMFTEEEERAGAKVVVLSYEAWQRLLGGDRQILGRTVELDKEPYEVVGIMPPGYYGPIEPAPPQLWIPLDLGTERRRQRLLAYGRLAEGVSLAEARQEIAQIGEELSRLYPEIQGGRETRVELVQEILVGSFRPALLMVFGAGAFLLLIVCGNVAHLLLARGMARRREMAVRAAMGAGRSHMLRQLVIENLLLASAAAAAGLGLAYLGLQRLKTLVPVQLGLPRLDGLAIDGRVLLFTLAVTLLVGLAFGLGPARLAFSRADLNADLSAGAARSTAGRRGRLLRATLVITEVALSLILLIGMGLMARTFTNLSRQEAGRDPSHVLTLRTSLRGPAYQDGGARADFFQRVQENIRAVPGVEAVGATNLVVLGIPVGGTRFNLAGTAPAAPGAEPEALLQVVSPTYFETLGTSLVQGRHFEDRDTGDAPSVAIVNRLFVASHLEGSEPVGRSIALADGSNEVREIVGVVENVRAFNNPPDPVPTIYVPHAQRPLGTMTTVVRTRTEPEPMIRSVRAAISELDRLMPTYSVTTLAKTQAEADWQSRFSMVLLTLFAVLAVVLAILGIYAVMASGVAERTKELGIRTAFGARPGDILSSVVANGLRLAAVGLVIGLVASFFLSRLLESQLYGIKSTDPWTYAGLTLLLTAIVVVASGIPALRAMKLDPVAALREE